MNRFFARHPLLRDALIWAIPALMLGALLRGLLLSYSPYAFWGADSWSFLGFTRGVLTDFYFSINEKRRYLYPLFLFPISVLPGPMLVAVGWIQAALGLLAVLPFAYIVRRIFVGWKWVIVPLTLLYAGLPVFIWFEHEVIADTILFDGMVWMLAGWMAWVSQADRARAARLWWWFFAPLAIIVLTKPSVKFFWPGIGLALVVAGAWRTLRWRHWTALGALFVAGLTVGDDDQSSWLLYTSTFPFTQLDTPLHAPYKAEIRDWVLEKRARIDAYSLEDYDVQLYLRAPWQDPRRPHWNAIAKDKSSLSRIYRDMAIEAIAARPDLFVKNALHRLLRSCNAADLDDSRFRADYTSKRIGPEIKTRKNPESMMRIAFGLPGDAPLPSHEQLQRWTNPHGDSAASRWMINYVRTYQGLGALVERPADANTPLDRYRPTLLGVWMLLGMVVACFPPFLRTVGVWGIALAGALVATYLVGITHVRYFAPVWPLVMLMLAVPIDGAIRGIKFRRPEGFVPS